jgi:hypothetical protein
MVEAMGLKLLYRGTPATKSHENLPSGSNFLIGEKNGQTDRHRQDGDLINLFPFWKVG